MLRRLVMRLERIEATLGPETQKPQFDVYRLTYGQRARILAAAKDLSKLSEEDYSALMAARLD